MGAVLISRNDLSAKRPDTGARIEEALMRAAAASRSTFRAEVIGLPGDGDVLVRIEERIPGQSAPAREVRLHASQGSAEMQRRIEDGMR
jgi:hypothetical protein